MSFSIQNWIWRHISQNYFQNKINAELAIEANLINLDQSESILKNGGVYS